MGFSCLPIMYNIDFAYFEYKFFMNHANLQDKSLLESLRYSFKYMDDLLSVNNKNFSGLMAEIYPTNVITIEPTFLNILEDTRFVTSTTYLNLELSLTRPYIGQFKVYLEKG